MIFGPVPSLFVPISSRFRLRLSRLMSLMSRVWEANLPAEDAKLLQLAEFQVLAVTPDAGYALRRYRKRRCRP